MTCPAGDSPIYDAVIVGAGAAGGIVAGVLAEAGHDVLLLERGPALAFEQVARDHLRNQRTALYGHNAGPPAAGHPRVSVDPRTGAERLARPYEAGYENNAACVGGGTRVWGAQAWRFLPDDFRMASRYGVPAGSALADWPISYADLAPWYERAEREIGVAGDAAAMRPGAAASPAGAGRASAALWGERGPYPLPPVAANLSGAALRRGAEALGWRALAVPLAINTAAYQGRPACAGCSYCVGFACPVDAKNGSQNTLLPRALRTGRCRLVTGAAVERIDTDARGDVTGVTYLALPGAAGAAGAVTRHAVRARVVIVSAGATESARLLLNSRAPLHPAGLGNARDLVGRCLEGHVYTGALGLFDDVVQDGVGPGVSVATCEFNHDNPDGIVGGGMMANEFVKLPIQFWRTARPPGVPSWGVENKSFMRHAYRRVIHVNSPVHNIPNPESRVEIAAGVRDDLGIPVARLSGGVHPETLRAAEYLRARAEEWLRAAGARAVWSQPVGYGRSGGQHQSGTCRMGSDPRHSVADAWGRVHGLDNLYVVDASLHVTPGGFNPALTAMALAFRCAETIAARL